MPSDNKKKSIGRRKIEIKKIASEEARQVCFSKRRAGLFKKANELTILCGVELSILVFSPGGKPYSFSHPSFDLIADRFLNGYDGGRHQPSSSTAIITSTDKSTFDLRSTQNLNNTHALNMMQEICSQSVEQERMKKAELDEVLRSTWFSDENLAKFDLGQLDFIQKKLASTKEQIHKVLMNSRSYYGQYNHNHLHVGYGFDELSNRAAGGYDPEQNPFIMPLNVRVAGGYDPEQNPFIMPLNVMNGYGSPHCFPPVYYVLEGA